MKIWSSCLAVAALILLAWAGAGVFGLQTLFGVVIPYLAFALFLIGFVCRVVRWGMSATPFRIPTTCGQQKTLSWIKQDKLENPSTGLQVLGRMLLEIFLFRSLFRNSKTEKRGPVFGFGSAKWLWLGGLVFHWSMLIVLLRHLRLFLNPTPAVIQGLEAADNFLQVGAPLLYITDATLTVALTYLFLRRVVAPGVRYISRPADYFPLLLLLAAAGSGILTRYFFKVDIHAVKALTMGLVTFRPPAPGQLSIGVIFYIHLFLVSCLFAYFPWSKLMHAGGVFLSPTRNMINNSRAVRHVNPWNYPVETHSYAEYEDQFREKMRKAGLPLETE
ncbi:MAG: sulfate reduction electron transfer complex DsrMKJOP subunit DsrM [Gracilibacteraceae bacterium]|jgi:nitrate reductase gamma subunit|nr:sulfate reduction electron transfer complex DsrMKJOP subunit DsrM [Gracilibacteraceae bacterium]